VHDETATTPAPRITDLDDAHVERDQPDEIRLRAFGEDSSPNAWVCPFLRAPGDDGTLGRPVEVPDAVNRCAALGESVPQSLRQQELVCLTSAHVNCPRHLRGTSLGSDKVERLARPRVVSPAIAGSVVVLIVAFLLSIGFVVANGGLTLTAAESAPSASPSGTLLAGLATAVPTAAATPASTVAPTATPATTPNATSSALASPQATAAPTALATPEPTPRVTPAGTAAYPPGATASRMKLLSPCTDKAKCYVYRIRSGDNLYSIANYFGVSLSTVKAWNAWTSTGLKSGRDLRIPPPTR
jgi:hypothetical protein